MSLKLRVKKVSVFKNIFRKGFVEVVLKYSVVPVDSSAIIIEVNKLSNTGNYVIDLESKLRTFCGETNCVVYDIS